MSGPGHSWKSEFQKRRGAFERREELDSSVSEDEGVLSGRRYGWERESEREEGRGAGMEGGRELIVGGREEWVESPGGCSPPLKYIVHGRVCALKTYTSLCA